MIKKHGAMIPGRIYPHDNRIKPSPRKPRNNSPTRSPVTRNNDVDIVVVRSEEDAEIEESENVKVEIPEVIDAATLMWKEAEIKEEEEKPKPTKKKYTRKKKSKKSKKKEKVIEVSESEQSNDPVLSWLPQD